jgi:hypothetical protein
LRSFTEQFKRRKLSKHWNLNQNNRHIPLLHKNISKLSYPLLSNRPGLTLRGWMIKKNKLQAEPIANNMAAIASYTHFFEAGRLHFNLTIDTEHKKDKFYLLIDHCRSILFHFGASGVLNKHVSLKLSRGKHTITFIYIKDGQKSSLIDKVSIDHFRYQAFH